MGKVISLRLKDHQIERLQHAARRLGRSPSEAAILLLEEALRQRDFPLVEFRDSSIGRQAYLQGTRLAVWQIASIARDFEYDAEKTAAHLAVPAIQIQAAMRYAAAYSEEIGAAIADNAHASERLEQLVPNLEIVRVGAPPA